MLFGSEVVFKVPHQNNKEGLLIRRYYAS